MSRSNDGSQFDRVPETAADRQVDGRATREEVLAFFADHFGIGPGEFESYTFWEKGAGKIWALRGTVDSPVGVETVGIHLLRTRQRHWKPTTDGIQLVGRLATRNVLTVSPDDAASFWNGTTQHVEGAVEDGYVIVAQDLAGRPVPLGVGLYLDGELRSVVPKSRQRDLEALSQRNP